MNLSWSDFWRRTRLWSTACRKERVSFRSCEQKTLVTNDHKKRLIFFTWQSFSPCCCSTTISRLGSIKVQSNFHARACVFTALGRQCLELLSMLNLREQRVYEGSKPQYSPERNTSVLEVRDNSLFYTYFISHTRFRVNLWNPTNADVGDSWKRKHVEYDSLLSVYCIQ